MVGTTPYQKRGKFQHLMPSFDKHFRCYSCRMHCKGEYPCASGAPLETCSAGSSLMEVEWNHLKTVFQERSAKRASKSQPESEPDNVGELDTGEIDDFIALIHPIQWTIANPVGADQPAKRQKKTSCVSTGWPVPVLCIRQVAHGIYFLSGQHDVISSFLFGECTVQTCFQQSPDIFRKSVDFQPYLQIF